MNFLRMLKKIVNLFYLPHRHPFVPFSTRCLEVHKNVGLLVDFVRIVDFCVRLQCK